jgi:UDP-N-acetylmuramoyl-tripeptide--D-alanyl-D-alanine ligase
MDVVKFYNLFIESNFSFTTDSRSIEKGAIFFALKGENFNGNIYANQALADGAEYAVIDEDQGDDPRLILVDDVLHFMQLVSHFHRSCYDIPVIAICGSNGKTTSKNLIRQILQKKYRTHSTQGNFNNHIGVPITLLQMPINTEIAVIELGTNNPGEIEALCKIADPDYGLITNIGKEHLEGFGTLEAVAKEESEIYHYILKNGGSIFLNTDDDWLTRMSRSLTEKITYSKKDVVIKSLVPSISFKYKTQDFSSKLMGDYNLDNILLAIAIGEHFDVDLEHIKEAISEYQPDNNRSQLIEQNGKTIILDAYNANPSSMQVAIKNFSLLHQKKKILILGDMFEMGPTADQEHLDLLLWCNQFNFHTIYALGDHFASTSDKTDSITPYSMEDLGEVLKTEDLQNAAFLIKGSRGMKMERVLDYL